MRFLFLGVALIAGLSVSSRLYAAETVSTAPDEIRKRIDINRSFIKQYTAEYEDLKKQLKQNPDDGMIRRKLTGAEYKLKALKDDSEKLGQVLPREDRAFEFVKDLISENAPATPLDHIRNRRPNADLHEHALQLVSERRLIEAIKVYEEIILNSPDDDEAYMIMGHSYLLTGDYQKAEMAFANAVHIDPSNIDDITPFYENMTLQNPDDDVAFSNLGFAWLIVGDFDKAKNAFEEALRINPTSLLARQGLDFSLKKRNSS